MAKNAYNKTFVVTRLAYTKEGDAKIVGTEIKADELVVTETSFNFYDGNVLVASFSRPDYAAAFKKQ